MWCHIRSVVQSLSIILAVYACTLYAQDVSPQSTQDVGPCSNQPIPAGKHLK